MKTLLNAVATIAALLALGGCAGLKELESARSLGDDEIVLVGRIELDPPLREDEQELQGMGSGRYRNRVMVVFGDQYLNIHDLGLRDLDNAAVVDLGGEFRIKVPRHDTVVFSGASILMNVERSGRVDYMYLPGGAEFAPRPQDEVVYLGTIRYHRDDYNDITDVEMISDNAAARRSFERDFGQGLGWRQTRLKRLE